ncbi:two-component system, OmpR family, sensor histidine kinase QseC [Moraxella cuniculi DSM 21768]|uniref:histidine kinase n=2 Tax=Moraxella cuniculi TaxID=34061 RepID=A0A1N7G285_9GAMM|nr:ATP-binding protein [Moraxella cuniculi]SIS06713.1 two-component system, OmpR family, sensor histidine kinase QseC [Moraxella cuniculi DSM 21768]VEG12117.1 Sensor protein qseC [Moraxella cuniculi]
MKYRFSLKKLSKKTKLPAGTDDLPSSGYEYSIQKRLLSMLLIGLPALWLAIVGVVGSKLWSEMSEMGDTQISQVAKYLMITSYATPNEPKNTVVFNKDLLENIDDDLLGGEDDYMGFAIWDKRGRLLLADDSGESFVFRENFQGFINDSQGKNPLQNRWRILYMPDVNNDRIIAVGQNMESRQEVILTALLAKLLPALVGLLLFLLLVWFSVRRAFLPLQVLGESLQSRNPADGRPASTNVPKEVRPLVDSLNRWFVKVADAIAREERFTADASHELKSPLTALKLQADMMQQAILSANLDEENERLLYEHNLGIKKGIERSNHLVNQLLTLAKLSVGEGQHRQFDTLINWQKVSDTVLSQSNLFARQKRCRLKRNLSPSPLPLYGDELLMEVLCTNLIDNAIRYCPEGSTIWLDIGDDYLSVYDNGNGVDEAYLQHLGERFFRPAGQKQTGSGLGLSIVQRICQMHKLKINFSNLYDNEKRIGFCVRLSK